MLCFIYSMANVFLSLNPLYAKEMLCTRCNQKILQKTCRIMSRRSS